MKSRLLLLFLSIILLTSGCQSQEASDSGIPSLQKSEAVQTSLTTQILETETIAPADIPESLTPTQDIAAIVIATSPGKIHSSLPSPDGKWKAEVVVHECVKVDPRENADAYGVESLKLVQVSAQNETIIASQLINCGGIGAFGIGGIVWSPNGQYFYYTDAREGMPDGLCGYWAHPIKRFSVNGQIVEAIGRGHLSPDRTMFAFWEESEIVIWSLNDGEIGRALATMPNASQNEISWSPDSRYLVYLETDLDCYPFGKSYVSQLDLSEMTQTILFGTEDFSFTWLSWDAADQISLVDDKGDKWIYDFTKQDLMLVP